MQIIWHGLSCFEVQTHQAGQEAVLVTDPYQNVTGLLFPRTLCAHVVVRSFDDITANNEKAIQGSPFFIEQPGEYEVGGIFVSAISAPCKNTKKSSHCIFHFEIEEIHLAHLGAIDRLLTDQELEQLQHIDILFVPVGAGRVLSPKMAVEVIEQLEPRVVIPMTYQLPNVKETLSSVEDFCKEFGSRRTEEVNKYKVTRKDLPEEDIMTVILSRV